MYLCGPEAAAWGTGFPTQNDTFQMNAGTFVLGGCLCFNGERPECKTSCEKGPGER